MKLITSQKKVIELLDSGFKLKRAYQFKRYFYYLTNYKEEKNVARNIIVKMKEKGIIGSDDCYKLNKSKQV